MRALVRVGEVRSHRIGGGARQVGCIATISEGLMMIVREATAAEAMVAACVRRALVSATLARWVESARRDRVGAHARVERLP
jgi:hypothetical protein